MTPVPWAVYDERTILTLRSQPSCAAVIPKTTLIFEGSTQAILVQEKAEISRCPVDDVKALEKLLNLFFRYERPEIAEFRKAVEQFKADLPAVIEALREMIDKAFGENVFSEACVPDNLPLNNV